MAAGIVPDIKDEKWVCQSECKHKDCAELRRQWGEGKCLICGKGFEAGQSYFYEGKSTAIHAVCFYEKEL